MKTLKICAAACAGLLLVTLFAGCDSKKSLEENETYDFSQTEKVYGQKMHDYKGLKIDVSCDDRFIDRDMASAVANYFFAIQTEDADLFRKSTVDFYEDYQINEVYKDRKYDEKSFIKAIHDGMSNNTQNGVFKIENIEINEYNDSENSGIEDIYELLEAASDDKFTKDDAESGVKLTCDFTLKGIGDGASSFDVTDQDLYVIKYDNLYHVISA